jgi:Tir chaperone protein (CesT) family
VKSLYKSLAALIPPKVAARLTFALNLIAFSLFHGAMFVRQNSASPPATPLRTSHVSPGGKVETSTMSPRPLLPASPAVAQTPACFADPAGQIKESVRRRMQPRKRVNQDSERLKRNRRTIDNYLRKTGTAMLGRELSLNPDGVAYFPFHRFIVVVEVPEDNPVVCFIYTMVCQLQDQDNQLQVLRLAMELNYMETATRGATLGLDGDEVNLCLSIPISGLSVGDMQHVLEDFTTTAVETNERLEAAKKKGSIFRMRTETK